MGGELTEAQEEQAEYLLEAATSVVAEAAGHDDAWADALDPVPNLLRVVTTEMAVRAMGNPGGLRQQSETLGQYSHSQTYRDEGAGLWLTPLEERLVRQTLGSGSGSVRVDSIVFEHELS